MPTETPFDSYSLSKYFFEFLETIEDKITQISTLSVLAFGGFIPIDSVLWISNAIQPSDEFLQENNEAIIAKTRELINKANESLVDRPYVATKTTLLSILDAIGFNAYLENLIKTEGANACIDPLFEWFGELVYSEATTDPETGNSALAWLEDLGFVVFNDTSNFMVSRSIQPVVIDGAESDNVILIMPICNPISDKTYNAIPSAGGGAAFDFYGVFKKANQWAFDHMDVPSDDTVLFFVDGFEVPVEELTYKGIPLVLPEESVPEQPEA